MDQSEIEATLEETGWQIHCKSRAILKPLNEMESILTQMLRQLEIEMAFALGEGIYPYLPKEAKKALDERFEQGPPFDKRHIGPEELCLWPLPFSRFCDRGPRRWIGLSPVDWRYRLNAEARQVMRQAYRTI